MARLIAVESFGTVHRRRRTVHHRVLFTGYCSQQFFFFSFFVRRLGFLSMAPIIAFTTPEKTGHNSHKFAFTLSPTNYGHWKTMVHPFLVTNHIFGYIDGSIACPPALVQSAAEKETAGFGSTNPSYLAWCENDAHVHMLLLSTISEASYPHVQGTTSRELWQSLERAYAPHSASREYTLKTQLLKIEMKGNESTSAYLTRAQTYADALANIGEPVKDKDLVMLVISGLREEYNGLKSTLLTRQHPTAFSELQGLLSDHDFMVRKTTPEMSPIQAFTAATSNRQQQPATGSFHHDSRDNSKPSKHALTTWSPNTTNKQFLSSSILL